MNRLDLLQSAKSLSDLAIILKYTPKGLAFVLYKLPMDARYRTFEIPKSNGGTRTIRAPDDHLKLLQQSLAKLLTDCLEEIEKEKPDRRKVSHGFQKGRTIVTNAKMHINRRFVLNLDLKDFFGTINFGRVRGFFIADRNFKLDPNIATIIAQIACHDNVLPQGAPSSPVISNLIGHILDARLIRLAREYSCTYSRYADDLTFSTNRAKFPRKLARTSLFDSSRWLIGKRLKEAIKGSGFAVNSSKTRMQLSGSRQEATGLIVNEKVNIRQEYYRSVRSMCFSLFQTGEYHFTNKLASDEKEESVRTGDTSSLEGRLAHVYYVKSRRDITPEDKKLNDFKVPNGPVKLYRQFLFFKYFVASELPVLVTEGKTDITYLRVAIKALQTTFPSLAEIKDKEIDLNVRFLQASSTNQQLLNLGTGFTGMISYIQGYDNLLKAYKFLPLNSPVVFVIDNDKGGEKVLNAANSVPEQDIKSSSTEPFFHIRRNLYLVKTPPGTGGSLTAIDDCFPDEVLKQKIGGKSLDLKKDHGDETSFGKHIFAEQIVGPGIDKIDFSGFAPILDGISKAIADYQAKLH